MLRLINKDVLTPTLIGIRERGIKMMHQKTKLSRITASTFSAIIEWASAASEEVYNMTHETR